MEIEWDWDVVNSDFKPLIDCEDRYLILYGGRGSSKSDFGAKRLIEYCLSHDHFRCIMIRKIGAKVKDSCYQNLKDLIEELGLSSLFSFVSTPTPRITCKINGNYFIGAGLDDTSKIKSIKDPTHVWWEEDIPDEGDFITITTSIRTTKAKFLQEIFTINPEVEGDYREHWFYKQFFDKHYSLGEFSFSDKITMDVDGKPVDVNFTVHHSTHECNPHLPDVFRAFLMSLKETNPYYYTIYTLGRWGTKIVAGRFYPSFNQTKHTYRDSVYDPEKTLHISFDFNVHPGISISIWQIEGNKAFCDDEILAKEPDNNTLRACELFYNKYKNHKGGIFIYGDPSGKAQDSKLQRGVNHYSIIRKALSGFGLQMKVFTKAPSVEIRGMFINDIFANNTEGIEIMIHERCTHVINDLLFGKGSGDGDKFKEKWKDKETGITMEKYHHFSDGLDYLIVKVFFNEYARFKASLGGFDYSEKEIQRMAYQESKRFKR